MTQQSLFTRQIVPTGTAEISPDGVYRWWLTRELGGTRPLVICGLNPSTADAEEDDNTIEKEMKFTRSWGCGRLVKVNTEDYRTKDPEILKRARKAGIVTSSPNNDAAILRAVELCLPATLAIPGTMARLTPEPGIFLAAWGAKADRARAKRVVEIVAGRVPIVCIKTNQDGSPVHPLYQKDSSMYRPWVPNV